MVCIHDTLNVEGMEPSYRCRHASSSSFGANIGIKASWIAPITPGNLVFLKKLFFAFTVSYGDVGNFTLANFESSARKTLPIIRETVVGCEIT